jgi:hypothetical protein
MAIERGIAVMFEAGPYVCGAVEIAYEEDESLLAARPLAGCAEPPAVIWLGKVGLCETHVLRMWPELGVRN